VLMACLAVYLPGSLLFAESVQLLRNAKVVTVSEADGSPELTILERASVLIRDGKIAAVELEMTAPEGAMVSDLSGLWLLPGFIDAHYPLGQERGGRDANEFTEAITEDFDVLTAFDPWDPELPEILARGVTSLAVSPGHINVIGGPVRVLKVAPGVYPPPSVSGLTVFKASLNRDVYGGPGLARFPTSAAGAMEVFRGWVDGRMGNPEPEPGRLIVRLETRAQAESVFRLLAGHKGLDAVISQGRLLGGDGHLDADSTRWMRPESWRRLPRALDVILGPLDLRDPASHLRIPSALEGRGTYVAFATDGYPKKDLLTSAVLARRNGLSFQAALASLTSRGARLLGVQDRIGRVAVGLDADLVAWTDNPFTLQGRVESVWVEGQLVHGEPAPGRRRTIVRDVRTTTESQKKPAIFPVADDTGDEEESSP